ncbi:MAG: protein kinase [Candidatus Aminicenantes bacterium]|nr:protein kinase [Candidatus Aminicenantes bacterium]
MIGKTILHYRILEKIGEGGMGVVYKAEDTKLKRMVALKFLPAQFTGDPQARTRFAQEAQSAAALDHPNICTIYEINEVGGQTYIAMAYIMGQSLKDKILSGPLDIPEAVNIVIQVAEGLKSAHGRGIIHRDIKPGNIMQTEEGKVKIMDFGLAKLERGADLTKTMTIMGTPAYMSPEQARGEVVDQRTDIWSLGCVFFEMLSGQLPFQSEHDQGVIYSILKEEPRPVFRPGKEIQAQLKTIIHKCLEKDPRNRYQDAAALAEALKSFEKPAQNAHKPSIAVLPFVDMSSQKDQEYFCDGIAEELINGLTHISDLRVVARTSAFAFKGKDVDLRDIGRKLNVDTVLEGSIRKAGNKLRITAQLIKVEDGFHLWSEKFDREMEDIFAIQDEISKAIVDNLKITLLAQEKAAIEKRHTDDPEAYNLYLKGLYFTYRPSPEALNKALDYFRKAIDADPNFALAYAGMANVYANFAIMSLAPPADMLPKAKTAFQKALALDSLLAEAHFYTAYIAFYFEWDWETSERSYERALAINPGNALAHALYAWACLARKRFEEAVKEIKLAQSLDPLMPLFYAFSVAIHCAVGKPDDAISEFERAVEMDPHSGLAYFHVGVAYVLKRETEKAITALQKSKELAVYSGWADGMLGLIHISEGDREKAERILEEMLAQKKRAYVSSMSIGWLWGALGNFDRAFEYFDKAREERDTLMPFVHIYTKIHAPEIQKDPRFRALLKKMKLDED